MSHLLFLTIPKHGHVLPVLEIVTELIRREHRVSFVTTAEFAPQVAATGADGIHYESTWPRADQPDPQVEVPADAAAWAPLIFLGEGRAVTAAVPAGDVPDLMVYDATIGHAARVLSRTRGIPAAQIFTTFAANSRFSLADLAVRFDGHPALGLYREGMRQMLDEHGLTGLDVPMFARSVEEQSLVLTPREFQIAGDTFDDRFTFVGPAIAGRASGQQWDPPADGLPVLLIALGTLNDRRPEFFAECVRALTGMPWHVVIAVGDRIDLDGFTDLPPNVEIHRSVPQLAVLSRASAFVSHAGMGSTMEAQYFGVPMVVVPQTPEQRTVGRRVAELGLGHYVDPADVTAEVLRDAVVAAGNDQRIRSGVTAMRDHVHRAGGVHAAADALLTRAAG
jgi:calicheamicin 4-deoxy-4-thio-alpha-D-digitoxosyltransferase